MGARVFKTKKVSLFRVYCSKIRINHQLRNFYSPAKKIPSTAQYLNFMLQMVDEVHLKHYLLSSDEVWRNIKGKGEIFGHAQLRVRENEINNTVERKVYQKRKKKVTCVLLLSL